MIKAFVLCAGLGTRLRPLTLKNPKALLPVHDQPMVHHIIKHLKTIGVGGIVINTHYLASQFETSIGDGSSFGLNIEYSYEEEIIDTGGGLKKVEYFLNEDTFIVHNCDVITNVDLAKMIAFHKQNKNQITLLASTNHDPKCLCVDKTGRLEKIVFADSQEGSHTFCGIHIVEPFIFKYIPAEKPISIIKVYNRLLREGIPINVFSLGDAFWQEIGSLESYEAINKKEIP